MSTPEYGVDHLRPAFFKHGLGEDVRDFSWQVAESLHFKFKNEQTAVFMRDVLGVHYHLGTVDLFFSSFSCQAIFFSPSNPTPFL